MADQLGNEELEVSKVAESDEVLNTEKVSRKSNSKKSPIVLAPIKYTSMSIVSFECKYPDNYSGSKPLKEGIHKITYLKANRFQSKNIGKIIS